MTVLDVNPNDSLAGPIEAAAGSLHFGSPMGNEPDLAPSILTTMREVGEDDLSMRSSNYFRYRTCEHAVVQAWGEGCERDGVTPIPRPAEKCSAMCWQQTPDELSFRPFNFYVLVEENCLNPDFDPAQTAAAKVREQTAFALSQEVDTGQFTGNPSLRSQGRDLTSASGPVSVTEGLMALYRAYRKLGQSGFALHMPYELTILMQERGLMTQRGGRLTAAGGAPINPGPAFSGVGPNQDKDGNPVTADLTLPDQGVYAIYATKSLIEYRVIDPALVGVGQNQIHERTNTIMAESMRRAAYRFNPECVLAVLVDISTPGCGS